MRRLRLVFSLAMEKTESFIKHKFQYFTREQTRRQWVNLRKDLSLTRDDTHSCRLFRGSQPKLREESPMPLHCEVCACVAVVILRQPKDLVHCEWQSLRFFAFGSEGQSCNSRVPIHSPNGARCFFVVVEQIPSNPPPFKGPKLFERFKGIQAPHSSFCNRQPDPYRSAVVYRRNRKAVCGVAEVLDQAKRPGIIWPQAQRPSDNLLSMIWCQERRIKMLSQPGQRVFCPSSS